MKFLAVRRPAWWPIASVVLTVRFHIMWLVFGENQAYPLPPAGMAMGHLLKLTFRRLTLSTPKRCHMDLWLAWLVLNHHRLQHLPSTVQASTRARVSGSFWTVVFFSCGLPFALYLVRLRAVVYLSLLNRCFMKVALLFDPLASRLATSTDISLGL